LEGMRVKEERIKGSCLGVEERMVVGGGGGGLGEDVLPKPALVSILTVESYGFDSSALGNTCLQ
jgi:hypothetical protein